MFETHGFKPSPGEQLRLLRSIEAEEPIVWRGLACLLKGQMLFANWEFREEAALAVYIAAEAILTAMRGRLALKKGNEVSFKELFDFLEGSVRHGQGLTQYLRDCYENRVLLAHASTRDGAFPIPPLIADDFYETYEVLVSLYRWFLLGIAMPEPA